VSEIAAVLGEGFEGHDAQMMHVAPLSARLTGSLTWSKGGDGPIDARGMTLIAPHGTAVLGARAVIRHSNPRGAFAFVAGSMFEQRHAVITTRGVFDIHETCVLGTDGHGYTWWGGAWLRFPHFGDLYIGDRVAIGAHTVVHRGALTDTVIGNGTKIGALCNVGHGVVIGNDVLIAPMVSLAGSVVVEYNAIIWQGATVREGVTIGTGATVAMGAVVVEDVAPYALVMGNPARPMPVVGDVRPATPEAS
jgi:UDP-3-O-[3-hydroxymyristoyl] glucosamine N-acyltransferase